MALTLCPECEKTVSDRAQSCPHCGYAVSQSSPHGNSSDSSEEAERSPTGIYDAVVSQFGQDVGTLVEAFTATTSNCRSTNVGKMAETFLAGADRLIEGWCGNCASLLRQFAVAPELRGTTNRALGQVIRAEAFSAVDTVLATYNREVAGRFEQLDQVSGTVDGVSDAAFQGALTGRIMGGLGGAGSFMSVVQGALAAGAKAQYETGRINAALAGIEGVDALSTEKLNEFFAALSLVAADWADFFLSSVFAASVDFKEQNRSVERMRLFAAEAANRCAAHLAQLVQASVKTVPGDMAATDVRIPPTHTNGAAPAIDVVTDRGTAHVTIAADFSTSYCLVKQAMQAASVKLRIDSPEEGKLMGRCRYGINFFGMQVEAKFEKGGEYTRVHISAHFVDAVDTFSVCTAKVMEVVACLERFANQPADSIQASTQFAGAAAPSTPRAASQGGCVILAVVVIVLFWILSVILYEPEPYVDPKLLKSFEEGKRLMDPNSPSFWR